MKTRVLCGLMIVVLALGGMVFAQTSNGTIAGTVTDQTKSVIIGATVTAKSLDTGATVTATTSSVGSFRLESLLPGNYTITATAKGFATTKIASVAVQGSVVTAINPELKPGNTESIEVVAGAETLQTENGEISATLPDKVVTEVPISSGNPYALATTLPGVTTITSVSTTNGVDFSVNGTRPRANNFLIEGQDNNDAGIHGQGMQPGNLEAVKEVVVMTNSYAAEFGHGGGSVSNMIYKSGSNQFHGSVWDSLRNSSLDANDHYNNINGDPKPKYRENLFGFSIGGPVVKNKLFFFGAYQWDNYRSSANGDTLIVPTEAGVATLQTLFANNPRANTWLSVIGNLRGSATSPQHTCIALGAAPVGGADRGCLDVGGVQRTGIPLQYNSPEMDLKGDYIISPSDTLSLRWIRTSFTAPYDMWNNGGQFAGFDSNQDGIAHNAGITEVHTFNANLINELRLSYGRIGFNFLNRPDDNPLINTPTISIGGVTGWGGSQSNPQGRFHNTMQFQDSMSWNTGKHNFKFGVDIADIRTRDIVPYNTYGSIGYSDAGGYKAVANFLDDFGGTSSVSQTFGSPVVRQDLVNRAYFIQDVWKPLSNLTLSIGLRYETAGTPNNVLPYPAIDPNNMDCFPCRVPQKPDSNDWGPRFSFAWNPRLFGDNKTVIRGGYGIFYDGFFTNLADNIQASSPNSISPSIGAGGSTRTTNRGTGNWSSVFDTLSPVLDPWSSQWTIPAHVLNPATYQWNLNIQRELPGKFTAQATYVGTRGLHQFGKNIINTYSVDTYFSALPPYNMIDPNRGNVYLYDNSGDSMYHGLQLDLERKMGKGLLIHAAYTWSKFMDDTSEEYTVGNWSSYPQIQYQYPNYNRKASDWGLSAFDHRQRLAITYLYEIPKIKGEGAAMAPVKAIFNGWQISGVTQFQSGTPINVEDGFDNNLDGVSNDRPNLGNPKAPMATYGIDGASWFGAPAGTICAGYAALYGGVCTPVDPSSVHWVIPGMEGSLQRNFIISPGTTRWDFSIQRTIKLSERHQFDIRAEMLDVFNHANTGIPNFTLATGIPNPARTDLKPTFGDYASTASGNRSIHLLFRYRF